MAIKRSLVGFAAIALLLAPDVLGQRVALSPSFLQAKQVLQASAVRNLQKPAAPRYAVVALRVAFQPDTSRFTTGNGTFDGPLFETLSPTVDPLPHNFGYFNAHLKFLENYVARVSDGKTTVTTHIVPEVIQVSRQMGAYSPTGLESGSDAELSKLAGLVQEAWALASEQSAFDMTGFDPATTAFVIFHAGVGRDIELVGTTLDKTPEDLPTIFFDAAALNRLTGASISFNGFPVTHSLVLPRTETRQGFDFIQDRPFLVEFSINGLLAASFFNFLGVPDLFDTSSGESGIGPFGLMDPLGLFAYNGLLPPEPTGWTKQYLGWLEPLIVDEAGPNEVSLSAASGRDALDELARVSISSSEYFLLENRHRDPAGDGLKLTVYRDGQLFEERFEHGQDDFNSFVIDGFGGGVVVDADDFDWALPGGRDEDGNDLVGGMLVWHIDENVIRDGLATNSVNADPARRGVDLEEADSAQDIGFPSGNIFAPQSHLGSPFDFFYEENPVVVISSTGQEVRLYQNRFGPDTYPNSNSNAGGPSFVVLDAFTPPDQVMNVRVRRENQAGFERKTGFPDGTPSNVPVGSYLVPLASPDAGIVGQTAAGEIRVIREGAPAVESIVRGVVRAPVGLPDGRVAALERNGSGEVGLVLIGPDGSTTLPLALSGSSTPGERSALLYESVGGALYALFADASSSGVYVIDPSTAQSQLITVAGGRTFSMAATDGGRVGLLTEGGVQWATGDPIWTFSLGAADDPGQLVIGQDRSGVVGAFTRGADHTLVFLQADKSVASIDVARYAEDVAVLTRYPVLVDLDADERLEALVTYGRRLLAFEAGGGLVDGFPIDMPAASVTQPLVASFGGGTWSILVGAEDGYIYAFDMASGGRQAPGFPLAVGAGIVATPALHEGQLFSIDAEGALAAWGVDGVTDVWWGQQYRDRFNTSFVRVIQEDEPAPQGALLPGEETYNWPNPIRDGETFFRLTPSEDVQVTITIIDAAGGLIDELDIENVRGNTATDVVWQTNAASGLYYARIEAVTPAGVSETKLIKMAIVR